MLSMQRFVAVGCFGCLVLSAVGCQKGPLVAPVTGVVTQDGEPLARAMVEFQPDKGTPSYGETDDEGRYELHYQVDRMGALLGHHYVSVRTAGEVTDPATDTTVNVPEMVPVEYNDETTLEYEVTKGDNVFDIKIEGKRKGRRRRM